jgi:hypothetical protein
LHGKEKGNIGISPCFYKERVVPTAPDVQAGLELFEMDWDTFVRTPSRFSAGPVDRAERAALLACASRDGVVTNYRCGHAPHS